MIGTHYRCLPILFNYFKTNKMKDWWVIGKKKKKRLVVVNEPLASILENMLDTINYCKT